MKLLYNARIYTLDPQRPLAKAMLIDRGRIVALGEFSDLRSDFGWRAAGEDLDGQVVIPGLVDAHMHLECYALGLQKVDCETPTRQECLRRVAERARNTPPDQWVLGHGWNQNDWPEGFGDASDLDAIAFDHPVYLTAKSLHAGWANTLALRLAGLGPNTPDPAGGRLGRHADGSLDGIVYESAMDLISRAIPEATDEQALQAIRGAQQALWSMGLTGVHDFDQRRCFAALQTLHQQGELGLRVIKSLPLESLGLAVELGLHSGFGDDFLRTGSVKAFADGALGPHTAAMFQPYQGEIGNTGMLFMDAEEMFEHGRRAVENGLSMAVHAIGDRANHEMLNGYVQLRLFEQKRFPGRAPLRHRIEHVQLLHPDDGARLAELGVIASMQPIHATSDMLAADRFWGERAKFSYAWRTQLQAGAVLAFGSDAPVESPNPFWGLHAAVRRRRVDGTPGPQGWYPEQRLTVEEALQGFTQGAAYAAGMEDRLGRLAPGYLADLLALETDPFTCEAEQLRNIRPSGTMVDGDWVYRR